MITLVAIFACVGLFLTVMGRWLMAREINGLPLKWKFALALLPMGDLVCLAGPWKGGKPGAIASLLGLALLLPVGGQAILDASNPHSLRKSELTALFTTGRVAAQAKEEAAARERLLAHKETKVKELKRLIEDWHNSLQTRRVGFEHGEAGNVEGFNTEAAAYHSFLAVGKEELAQLEALRAANGK